MQLHHRALSTLASPETHTFKIVSLYTGKHITCTLARETKCYYVMWSQELSGGRSLERRFHKATMTNDELMLIITVTADDKAKAQEEVAALIDAAKANGSSTINEVTRNEEAQLVADVEEELADEAAALTFCASCNCEQADPEAMKASPWFESLICAYCSEREAEAAQPIAFINDHDAPHFCPACEGYCKTDEMTASAWVTALICIDCATAEENALSATLTGIDCKIVIDMRPLIDGNRRRQAMIESVLEMNYIGGHLAGYHFTPTLKELPRNLFAYRPNTGREGSPNAAINKLGYFVVNLSRRSDARAIYDCLGNYLIHGSYDLINDFLIDIISGD